jgi:hypothetical protein
MRFEILASVNIKIKVKVNGKASRNEDVWGSGGIAPPFLTAALE